jgi:L-cysteine:1D-myo-inositol 2-amino-2-deoxy-alpha-D-glucopyranoside ligase
MRAWSAPEIPALHDRAPVPSIFDSRLNEIVGLPRDTDSARLYVCGITPYDATHMGHAATYVAFDLLNRAWRDAGYQVTFVQNVTDVDDPLIERAEQTGVDWKALAEDQTDLFRGDMEALSVIPPEHYIGATESVDWIVPWVEQMVDEGLAYRAEGYVDG